jgi:Fic family protein
MYVETPPQLETLFSEMGGPEQLLDIFRQAQEIGVAPEGRYRHWNTLRHLTPPAPLTHKQWWFAIKVARATLLRKLPLRDPEGSPFVFGMPDEALALLHYIDQHASGEIRMPEVVIGEESAQQQYLVHSLIEEAIRSSQLEGATTTRRVAKEMLRSGRAPRNRSERMIANNYAALEFMRADTSQRLTPEFVLELQRILTEGTLENPDAAGRVQLPTEDRVAVYDHEGQIIHQPPPAEQLLERLEEMCRFANGEEDGGGFLHPVVRAILLHFWLAYDHPFEDGNGRTARALFYWSMRKQGYWLAEYLSISEILRKAPARYTKAFLYSETDDRDTTYFILFHLAIFTRAIEELHKYLQRKMREVREFERFIRASDGFNHRQLDLLRNAVRHPDQNYTFRSHARSHNVTFQTARTDLLSLKEQGLLELKKRGRQFVFFPADDLPAKLAG